MIATKCEKWDYAFVKNNLSECLRTAFKAIQEKGGSGIKFDDLYTKLIDEEGQHAFQVSIPYLYGGTPFLELALIALKQGFFSMDWTDDREPAFSLDVPSAPQRGDFWVVDGDYKQYIEANISATSPSWVTASSLNYDKQITGGTDSSIPSGFEKFHGFGDLTVFTNKGIYQGTGWDGAPLRLVSQYDGFTTNSSQDVNTGLLFNKNKAINSNTGEVFKVLGCRWNNAQFELVGEVDLPVGDVSDRTAVLPRNPTAQDGQVSFYLYQGDHIQLDKGEKNFAYSTSKQFFFKGHIDDLPTVDDPSKNANQDQVSNVFYATTYETTDQDLADYFDSINILNENLNEGTYPPNLIRLPFLDAFGSSANLFEWLVNLSWRLPFMIYQEVTPTYTGGKEWYPDPDVWEDDPNTGEPADPDWSDLYSNLIFDELIDGVDTISGGALFYFPENSIDCNFNSTIINPPIDAQAGDSFLLYMYCNGFTGSGVLSDDLVTPVPFHEAAPLIATFNDRCNFPALPYRRTNYYLATIPTGGQFDTEGILRDCFSTAPTDSVPYFPPTNFRMYKKKDNWSFS